MITNGVKLGRSALSARYTGLGEKSQGVLWAKVANRPDEEFVAEPSARRNSETWPGGVGCRGDPSGIVSWRNTFVFFVIAVSRLPKLGPAAPWLARHEKSANGTASPGAHFLPLSFVVRSHCGSVAIVGGRLRTRARTFRLGSR